MTEQPEALRLAIHMEASPHHAAMSAFEAAAELRRQNSEIERLRQLLEQQPVASIDTSSERVEKSGENVHEQRPVKTYHGGKPQYVTDPTNPAKEWVGLTDEERRHIRKCNQQHDAFAKAIEAKLKEKNT